MEYNIGVSVLDGWEIIRRIGVGTFGQVYEIRKRSTSYGVRPISSALKVIRIPYNEAELESAYSEGMDDKSATSYFKGFVDEIINEINIMSELKAHQGVVSCEDFEVIEYPGKVHWDILIRMELLTPLVRYTMEHKLKTQEILRLGIEISDALSHCHAKGMIHRDVKPENIFIDELGHFKLGDFGIARTMEKSTKGMSSKGTESYMAPEVFLNKDYDKSVDVYSLGLVLYRYFNNNRLPFVPQGTFTPGDRTDAIIRRIRGDKFPRIPYVSEQLNAILLKACAYEAADRFNSAEEMQDALIKFADAEKIHWDVRYKSDVRDRMYEPMPSAESMDTAKDSGDLNKKSMKKETQAPETEYTHLRVFGGQQRDRNQDLEHLENQDNGQARKQNEKWQNDAASELNSQNMVEHQQRSSKKHHGNRISSNQKADEELTSTKHTPSPALARLRKVLIGVLAVILINVICSGIWMGSSNPDGTVAYLKHLGRVLMHPQESPYEFHEEAIETVVRKTLNLPEGNIYPSDLEEMRSLVLIGKGITDIRDIQLMTNLTTLNLGYNEILDISALSGLTNLTELSLIDNNIRDISALSGLTKLKKLWLDGNNISDTSPVNHLNAEIYW